MRRFGTIIAAFYGVLIIVATLFAQELELHSDIVLRDDAAEFGGLSGLEITDEGFVAVSDKGTIWRGDLARDADGKITEHGQLEWRPILKSNGDPVDKYNIDAEGLDRDADGNLLISFESNSRVSRFATWDGVAELIPSAEGFSAFGYNSGPEAMTIGPAGHVWLSPERSGVLTRPFPIFDYNGKSWNTELGINRKPPYLLVGMDYDPIDKRLYILERDFRYLTQFSSRIRVFDYADNQLGNERELWRSDYGEYGNFEGISHWRNEGGEAFLSLISDDNFSLFFATRLIEFKIK